ncbi:nitroreductase family protein [Phenylobacterium sp.]|uniref:Acg family FMN-binding oxidoreductase n=1 Tax=Phenylobacterium sp. TaxID=1871053 RepID=UPI002733D4FB|nr:nitroreductase family protein [Phenylobacterium sp.]MDP3660527.1 nitroreductase family protein [Phenylobacterium sp.]
MNRRAILIGAGATLVAGAGVAAGSLARMGAPKGYASAMSALRAPLRSEPGLRDVVRYATLAPSGHNTQPWRFRLEDKAIRILPDLARRTPVVDPDDHHLYVSLGCAAQNLALAAQAHGLTGETRFEPKGAGEVVFEFKSGGAARPPLLEAISHRQSTRSEFDARPVAASDLALLERAAQMEGVDAALIIDRRRLDRIRDLVISGNSAQMADPAFVDELKNWMRFNPRAALAHGDGLYSAASGNPILPTWLGGPMFDLAFKASSENQKYARHMDTASGVAVFVAARADPEHWVRVGWACQRFALQATALGMKVAFINQPVEVAALRDDLAALVGAPGRRPDIVIRFGYGPSLPMSPRRPVASVLDG